MIWHTYGADGSRLLIERTALGWIVSADRGIDHLRRSLKDAVAAATGQDSRASWIARLEWQIEGDLRSARRRISGPVLASQLD